jgi:hypothetical protein
VRLEKTTSQGCMLVLTLEAAIEASFFKSSELRLAKSLVVSVRSCLCPGCRTISDKLNELACKDAQRLPENGRVLCGAKLVDELEDTLDIRIYLEYLE